MESSSNSNNQLELILSSLDFSTSFSIGVGVCAGFFFGVCVAICVVISVNFLFKKLNNDSKDKNYDTTKIEKLITTKITAIEQSIKEINSKFDEVSKKTNVNSELTSKTDSSNAQVKKGLEKRRKSVNVFDAFISYRPGKVDHIAKGISLEMIEQDPLWKFTVFWDKRILVPEESFREWIQQSRCVIILLSKDCIVPIQNLKENETDPLLREIEYSVDKFTQQQIKNPKNKNEKDEEDKEKDKENENEKKKDQNKQKKEKEENNKEKEKEKEKQNKKQEKSKQQQKQNVKKDEKNDQKDEKNEQKDDFIAQHDSVIVVVVGEFKDNQLTNPFEKINPKSFPDVKSSSCQSRTIRKTIQTLLNIEPILLNPKDISTASKSIAGKLHNFLDPLQLEDSSFSSSSSSSSSTDKNQKKFQKIK